MTTTRYLDLVPEMFASSDELADYRKTVNDGGWTIEYAAPAQFVRPDRPVSLVVVNRQSNGEKEARKQAANDDRMSPLEAMVILLELLDGLSNRRNPQARTMARAPMPRNPRAFMRQGLKVLAGVPRRDFDSIDPSFRLRLAVYGPSVMPQRMQWLAAHPNRASLKTAAVQNTPSVAVRMPAHIAAQAPAPVLGGGSVAAFQSRRRRRNPGLDPYPYLDAI